MASRIFFPRHVFSDLRPKAAGGTLPVSSLWTAAWLAACSDPRENWDAPKITCHPGFVENCHLSLLLPNVVNIIVSAIEERDQRAIRT